MEENCRELSERTFKSNLPLILEIQNKAVAEGNTTEIIRSLKAEFAVYKDTQDDPKMIMLPSSFPRSAI
ncbi:hypothetical protein EJ377_00945 [Chryseobacterium arthrosphaerae]|uniref:Uncharacterized protein n=1 Tax=Chryseobacterium arthrosphaerae TaxID=651561 RepID=A0A432DYJ9_9FLAO|nr:hypothetical protein EJ377_00945 [Chryseobacterium arthrosphaerae]